MFSSSDGDGSRLVPAFIFAAVSSLCALAYFADREVSAWTRAQAASAWTLALFVVAVVPLDVAATVASSDGEARGASTATLANAWDVGYWSTYALTWVILPLCQSYEDCADFKTAARMKRYAGAACLARVAAESSLAWPGQFSPWRACCHDCSWRWRRSHRCFAAAFA